MGNFQNIWEEMKKIVGIEFTNPEQHAEMRD